VYERNGWLLYKRFNGKWYLDLDLDMYKVSNGMGYLDFESWSGTVNYALTASDTPFTATWNRDMVVAHSTVSVVGKPAYSATSAGAYNLDLQTTFAGAPVYRRAGTSWSLYKRSNGYWYLDFNELDDTWGGTVNYALGATALPFAARFNGGGMKVLRGSSWQAPSTISSAITCSSGSWHSEVGWSLTCSDGTTLSGGAPYTSSSPLAVAVGATCTLDMTDSYGDGWNGAEWEAPGFGQSFSLANGMQGTKSFVHAARHKWLKWLEAPM